MLNLFCKPSEKKDIFAAITPTAMDNQLEQTTYKGERVRLCTDGKYRWTWPMQKKKAEKMGCLIALAGIFAKRPSVAGAGFMTAAHTKTSSDFSRVRRIKAYPRLHSIKVNEGLSKNQVYTHPEDFSFVLDYIQSHCPKCSKK